MVATNTSFIFVQATWILPTTLVHEKHW